MKLGTLLLREATINLSQLEAALRAQVLDGGRLGSNLVELGFLDLDALGRYLAEVSGVPVATQVLFESAPRDLIERFGVQRAERHGAFPLHVVADPPVLAVALLDPRGHDNARQLATDWGTPLVLHVAPELRMLYYLERHYGIRRKARFVRIGAEQASPQLPERRRSHPDGATPRLRVEPRSRRKTSEPVPAPPAPREPQLGFPQACDALDRADHRDQIGDVLIKFTIGRFAAAAVFLVRGGNALGWRLHPATAPSIDDLVLPLDGNSILQQAHDGRRLYRGPPPTAEHPVEQSLWDAFGIERAPREMLVVPVIVKQRVVNLIYVQGGENDGLPESAAADLTDLAARASAAYVRLIRTKAGNEA